MQVERLLADALFSKSRRCSAFLRFVTGHALQHPAEALTERALGVELFGRPHDYDTDADPIVRVTASEVRKRLAQYYADPAHAGQLRVVIHKGTYAAVFLAPGAPPAPEARAGVAGEESTPPAAQAPRVETGQGRRIGWVAVAGTAVVVAAAALTAKVALAPPRAQEAFWAPALDGQREVLLSIPQFSDHVRVEGIENARLSWTDPLTPVPDPMGVSWAQYSRMLVHVGDLTVACRLSEWLGARGKRVVIRGEHDLTMRDLREAPAVILGGLNNQWTDRLLPGARFSFGGDGTLRFIRDRQHPDRRPWQFDAKVPTGARDKDYILISRAVDSASGRVTVLAGGFSSWGTDAAVALLIDAAQMDAVLGSARHVWKARNLQLVLECSVVNRQAGIPRLVAAHSW